jgi:pyruvate/2-oxoglutarate/acetoin dehydrogenase E1 component
MTAIDLGAAIDLAIEEAMARDPRVIVMGEDVPMMRRGLFARFGPRRVRGTPISESAFLGAGVGAALGGLRPVVEVMFVDFLAVALHALSNEAAMVETLSGGRWRAPVLVRAACGGGYGDAGQHEQSLWGLLSSVPGLVVVAPSTPEDAAGLTLTALEGDHGPVVLLEHKLLSALWRDAVAGSPAARAALDVPSAEPLAQGSLAPVPFGSAAIRREGRDVLVVSVGMAVHRCLAAAEAVEPEGISVRVMDVRSTAPLDRDAVRSAASEVRSVLVVDEDYGPFGLSAEVLATVAEAGTGVPCARLTGTGVIPYARRLEAEVLPTVAGIVSAIRSLCVRA